MKVLLVEDSPERIAWFRLNLAGAEIDQTDQVPVALAWLAAGPYDEIFLDHDLAEHHYAHLDDPKNPFDAETGYAVASYLAEHPDVSPGATITIHSLNPIGARRMGLRLRDGGRRRVALIPFFYLRGSTGPYQGR